MKTLVAYFSRTGNNRLVANEINKRLNGDIIEIISKKKYRGPFGFIRCIRQSTKKYSPQIKPLDMNPADYDLVVISSPVWIGNISAPARSFLRKYIGDFKHLAFVAVCGGAEGHNAEAFSEVERLAGDKLISTEEVFTRDALPEELRNDVRKTMAVRLKEDDIRKLYKARLDNLIKKIKTDMKIS